MSHLSPGISLLRNLNQEDLLTILFYLFVFVHQFPLALHLKNNRGWGGGGSPKHSKHVFDYYISRHNVVEQSSFLSLQFLSFVFFSLSMISVLFIGGEYEPIIDLVIGLQLLREYLYYGC